jgi:hypothetical protein
MKRVLFFAAIAILASCSNNQQPTDKTNQAKMDSMSQVLMRQHIIDSMNGANTAPTAPAAASPVTARHSHESHSYERSHSYTGNAPAGNTVSAPPPTPITPAAPAVSNTVRQPSAADLAAQKKAAHQKELKSAAEGALIGAGAGAIGGAVAGKNAKFKKQDAAIGGGVGAVLGAGAGLLLEKHKLKKDTTQH